jgi:HlyD family secretion protein
MRWTSPPNTPVASKRSSWLDKAGAELARAEAEVREAQATIVQREREVALAKQELARALPLVREGSLSQRTADQRQSQRDTAAAALKAEQAHLVTHTHAVEAARAEVQRLQTQLDDNRLRAPVKGASSTGSPGLGKSFRLAAKP